MCHVFYRRFRLAGESRLKLWYDYFFDRCYFRSFCCVVEEEVYGKGRQEHEQLMEIRGLNLGVQFGPLNLSGRSLWRCVN